MKKLRSWLILLVVLAALVGLYVLGKELFGSPASLIQAHLHIPKPKPEIIFRLHMGSLDLRVTNTAFTSFAVMAFLVILAALVSRGLSRKSREERIKNPRGWQNLAEWAVGYVIGLLEPAAGHGKVRGRPVGRLIFPLVGTLFIFIISANWLSLAPGFSSILVRAPFLPVEEGTVSFEVLPSAQICPGDTITFHASAEQATAPEFIWYVNGVEQEPLHQAEQGHAEEGETEAEAHVSTAWFDYHFERAGSVFVGVEAWNEDEEGHRYSAAYRERIDVLYGEEALAVCTEDREPLAGAAHEEEHDIPGLVWLFGGDSHGGLAPILRAANSHLAITAGMAIIAIICVQAIGVVIYGGRGYLKHLATDAPVWMRFIMFPIHVISEFSRIISLSARLFGNLYGGDVLLAVIFNLIGPILPAIFLGIEAFFYYIQALLFSVLTTVYISLLAAHGHEEGAHH